MYSMNSTGDKRPLQQAGSLEQRDSGEDAADARRGKNVKREKLYARAPMSGCDVNGKPLSTLGEKQALSTQPR